jgi:hypothetical protein
MTLVQYTMTVIYNINGDLLQKREKSKNETNN